MNKRALERRATTLEMPGKDEVDSRHRHSVAIEISA